MAIADSVEVAIIGAGPAGMAAAVRLAQGGVRPLVLDRAAAPGGQIYRQIGTPGVDSAILGRDYRRGRALWQAFRDADSDYRPGSQVWWAEGRQQDGVSGGVTLGVLDAQGNSTDVHARTLIVASGALERGWPFPGWQLPGVMTAGAAQIMLKQGGLVPDVPTVLAGSGPLLYLLAAQYLRAGVKPAAILDLAPAQRYRIALRQPALAWRGRGYLLKGIGMMSALKRAGVPIHHGIEHLEAPGEGHVDAVEFTRGGRRRRIAAGLLLTHFGVTPDPQLVRALELPQRWHDGQQCFVTVRDDDLQARPGIYVVGDGGAIGGAVNAALEGQLAALAILAARTPSAALGRERRAVNQQRCRDLAVRPLLEALFRLPDDWLVRQPDRTVVCRCECVSKGALDAAIAHGGFGPNQLKAFTRCGMGPCQGRQCGESMTRLLAARRRRSHDAIGYARSRPPLVSVTLGELAGPPSDDGGQSGR